MRWGEGRRRQGTRHEAGANARLWRIRGPRPSRSCALAMHTQIFKEVASPQVLHSRNNASTMQAQRKRPGGGDPREVGTGPLTPSALPGEENGKGAKTEELQASR